MKILRNKYRFYIGKDRVTKGNVLIIEGKYLIFVKQHRSGCTYTWWGKTGIESFLSCYGAKPIQSTAEYIKIANILFDSEKMIRVTTPEEDNYIKMFMDSVDFS